MDANEFNLTVEALAGDERSPAIRLREWLDVGLRTFGLRCNSIAYASEDGVERGFCRRPQHEIDAEQQAAAGVEDR